MWFISVPIASVSIGNRAVIQAAFSWTIVVTTASNGAFRYFTGNTMRQWIYHAQCAPFLTALFPSAPHDLEGAGEDYPRSKLRGIRSSMNGK